MCGAITVVGNIRKWSIMPKDDDLRTYNYWGQADSPPENLKTRRQLNEMGLAPLKAVGKINTTFRSRHYTILLYDSLDPTSCRKKRVTPKLLYNMWFKRCGVFVRDRVRMSLYFKQLLNEADWVVLDSLLIEVNGEYLLDLAIVDHQGHALVDTCVRSINPSLLSCYEEDFVPVFTFIPNELIDSAPNFSEFYQKFNDIVCGKRVFTFTSWRPYFFDNLEFEIQWQEEYWIKNCYSLWRNERGGAADERVSGCDFPPYVVGEKEMYTYGDRNKSMVFCEAAFSCITEMSSDEKQIIIPFAPSKEILSKVNHDFDGLSFSFCPSE